MQVRFGAVARVANQAQDLTSSNFVSHLHLETARLKMCVERETPAAEIENDVITADSLQSDGNRSGVQTRHVFWNTILHRHNGGVRDCEHFASIGVVRLVVLFIAGKCPSVCIPLYPVD